MTTYALATSAAVRRAMHCATLLVAALLLLAGCSCGDSLVMGQCAPGFVPADGRCTPVDAGLLTDGAQRDATPDATRDTGTDAPTSMDADVPNDGGMPDGTVPDGSIPDASMPDAMVGCGVGTIDCDGECVRPDIDKNHCGNCETMCAMGEVCSAGLCVPACPAPKTVCPQGCVDLTKDRDNCGMCARKCSSGICSFSLCEEAAPGHLILIGHDYRKSNKNMNRVAGNAVFMATGQTVNVVTYLGGVTPQSLTGVNAAIDEVATARGRSWAATSAMPGTVSYLLASADVFLVYPQRTGNNAALTALGDQWKTALGEFLARGGIVVVFDGAAIHAGTWQILQGAGLFQADGPTTLLPDSLLTVTLPVDSVVLGVPITYTAVLNTVWFNTTDPNVVVRHPDGPVVIHRVFVPSGAN